ncbi:MAG: tetraacyldisaccharide 4'-kinase [Bacteroidetes bacterium]|nr:tetraacyldisaccharide 4'-kinase [Bacteroidota bacterium]
MPWYAYLLAPAAFLFHGITAVRNMLFDQGLIPSKKSPIRTLVVGNLSVGGTGKTPFVEFLVRKLRDEVAVGTLSRGYGRSSKGFIQLVPNSSADEVGDEPLQLYRQFKEEIPVFVGEDRVVATQKIQQLRPELQLLILDDAFQHRKLNPDFRIVLTPYNSPFSKDYLLPMGRLRESRVGAKRAELVVVTKCPANLSQEEKNKLAKELAPYLTPEADLFFSTLNYGRPYQLAGPSQTDFKTVIALAGLADNGPFLDYCKQQYAVVDSFSFPDHYAYRPEDAARILKVLREEKGSNAVLLTTEKDAAKLKSLAATEIWSKIPIFALPIQVALDPKQEEQLLQRLRKNLLHP